MNEPTATTDTAQETPSLSPQEMSDSQLSEFFAKGTRFDKPADDSADAPSADQAAESAPAEPAAQAASTDASSSTASETVKPERKTKGKGVTERNDTLRAEIEENARLLRLRREQRDELARADAPARPKQAETAEAAATDTPAATKADWKRFRTLPGAPQIADFSGEDALEDFIEAKSAFIAEQLTKEQFGTMFEERERQSHAEQSRHAELNEAITVAEDRAAKDEARDPKWREKVDPAFARIAPMRMLPTGTRPNVMNLIKDQLMFECEHPCSLSVFMSSDEGKAWAAKLVQMPASRVIREIALKDASFGSDAQDDEPTNSYVSSAPSPGETLGRKPSKPVDALKSAVASGDVEGFINQRNRAAVARA